MRFPGSKLLHTWDLAVHGLSFDDLLRSCQQVGLTGFAEVKLANGVGMILYYLGGEVNALYREGGAAHHGKAALDRLRSQVGKGVGVVSIYELPLDMAHLLRGITNRQRLPDQLRSPAELDTLLSRVSQKEHTGTLEIQTGQGVAMVLLIGGRLSNVYWETPEGQTYEKGEARERLDAALPGGEIQAFLSEFSREVWKSRQEVRGAEAIEIHPRDAATADQLVAEETALRNRVLTELFEQVPALIQAVIFDLITGVVLARKGRSTEALRAGLVAEKLPAITQQLRKTLAASEDGQLEMIELATGRVAALVAIVPDVQEAIAVVADKSMPSALTGAALSRCCRSYPERLRPSRKAVGA
jgi:hypothetical protein